MAFFGHEKNCRNSAIRYGNPCRLLHRPFRGAEHQPQPGDRRTDGGQQLPRRDEDRLHAEPRHPCRGAHVPVQRKPHGRAFRRIHRCHGGHLAHPFRDVQPFRRLEEMAVLQCDNRILHPVQGDSRRDRRSRGERFRQSLPCGRTEQGHGLIRPDTLQRRAHQREHNRKI